jgi:hypothetical protein
MKFSRAELRAIDYIGNHRKTHARVGKGKPISTRIFNQLRRKGLVMWLEDGKTCMLTYPGELVWSKMHPFSKYADPHAKNIPPISKTR